MSHREPPRITLGGYYAGKNPFPKEGNFQLKMGRTFPLVSEGEAGAAGQYSQKGLYQGFHQFTKG